MSNEKKQTNEIDVIGKVDEAMQTLETQDERDRVLAWAVAKFGKIRSGGRR